MVDELLSVGGWHLEGRILLLKSGISTPAPVAVCAGNTLSWQLELILKLCVFPIASLRHEDSVVTLQWHATLPVVVTGCLDFNVRVWDARSGEELLLFLQQRRC